MSSYLGLLLSEKKGNFLQLSTLEQGVEKRKKKEGGFGRGGRGGGVVVGGGIYSR